MAVSVKSKKPKKSYSVVAVRTYPPIDIERSTDFLKADTFDCVEVDGIAVYRIFRDSQQVASYPASGVLGIRNSTRKFRTDKVNFVRRIERVS